MSKLVKLELELNTLTVNQKTAFVKLMTALTLDEYAAIEQEEQTNLYDLAKPLSNDEKVKAEEAPKKTRAKKVAEAAPEAPEALEQEERTDSEVDKYEASKVVEVKETKEWTVAKLQELVTPSILGNHRKALKDKIIQLGSGKMAEMDPANFQEFADFIAGLK